MTKHGKCCRKFITRASYQKTVSPPPPAAATTTHFMDVATAADAAAVTATATITLHRRCQRCPGDCRHRIFNENYVDRLLAIKNNTTTTTTTQSQSSFSFVLKQASIADSDTGDDDDNIVTTVVTTTATNIANIQAHCLNFNYLTHKYDSKKPTTQKISTNNAATITATTAATTKATSLQAKTTSCCKKVVNASITTAEAETTITTAAATMNATATACNTNQSTNSIYYNAAATAIATATKATTSAIVETSVATTTATRAKSTATTLMTTTTTVPFTDTVEQRRAADKHQQRHTNCRHRQQQQQQLNAYSNTNMLLYFLCHMLLQLPMQHMSLRNMLSAAACQRRQQQHQRYCWQLRAGKRLQLLPAALQLLLIIQLTTITPQLVSCSNNNVVGAAVVEFGGGAVSIEKTATSATNNLSNKAAAEMAATQLQYQQQIEKAGNVVKGGISNAMHGLALAIGVDVVTLQAINNSNNSNNKSNKTNSISADTQQHIAEIATDEIALKSNFFEQQATSSGSSRVSNNKSSTKTTTTSVTTSAVQHHASHQQQHRQQQQHRHHQQQHYQNMTAPTAANDANLLLISSGSGHSIINLINRDNVLKRPNFGNVSANESGNASSAAEKIKVVTGGNSGSCPSCQMHEKLKLDNLESIKLHILMRLQLSKLPNITAPISVPHNILEKFYKHYNASLGARGRGRSAHHGGRIKANHAEKHGGGGGNTNGGGGTLYQIQQEHTSETAAATYTALAASTTFDVNAAAAPAADALDELLEGEVSNDSFDDDVAYADDMPNDDPHVYQHLPPHENEEDEVEHDEDEAQQQQQTSSVDEMLLAAADLDHVHVVAHANFNNERFDDNDDDDDEDDDDDDDDDDDGNYNDDDDFGFGHHHFGADDNFDNDFYSRINRVYVFPITPRIRHNRKPELLNFKFDNQHSTISRAIVHIYIRGRDWMRAHNPARLELKRADGTTAKRRELVIAIYRAVRRPNALNFTHTVKLVESHQKIPGGQGQWIQIEVQALSAHWMQHRNATQGIVIKGQEPWMRPFIVTGGDSSQNKPLTIHIEIMTKEKRRRKRSTSLDCQESDHEVRCCRYPLKVNFTNFGWHFVVAPTSFDAYFCNGECKVGYLEQYTHTHIASLTTSATPCCSPTKMSPLSLLYFNDNQNLVLSTIPNMSVEKCSCS